MLIDLAPPPHHCNALAYELLVEALADLRTPLPPGEAHASPLEGEGPRPWRRNWPWTHDEMVTTLLDFVTAHARLPTLDEWRHASDYGLPSHMTTRRVCGSKVALIRAAGLIPVPRRTGNQYTTRRLIDG